VWELNAEIAKQTHTGHGEVEKRILGRHGLHSAAIASKAYFSDRWHLKAGFLEQSLREKFLFSDQGGLRRNLEEIEASKILCREHGWFLDCT
jgi:hypothetical protein